MDFESRGWPPQPQIFSSSSTKITKNAKFRTSDLRCWRLCRLSSKLKIHSKGCKSNGEALWLVCYCLISLSTYWFSDIFSPFINHILRWNTLYIHISRWSLTYLALLDMTLSIKSNNAIQTALSNPIYLRSDLLCMLYSYGNFFHARI